MAKSRANYSFLFDPRVCILNRPPPKPKPKTKTQPQSPNPYHSCHFRLLPNTILSIHTCSHHQVISAYSVQSIYSIHISTKHITKQTFSLAISNTLFHLEKCAFIIMVIVITISATAKGFLKSDKMIKITLYNQLHYRRYFISRSSRFHNDFE